MSELDTLSDSDWLDIASGQDSEGDESLGDESEGEPLSQPLSRASSSLSIASSNGGVDAWEGFVEQHNASELAANLDLPTGMYTAPLVAAPSTERIPLGLIPDIVTDQDRAEEELVNEALNQSLVGTLNASRTSTGSARAGSSRTSVRDLRLSFPDPLTSPRDELERSYQEVAVDEGKTPSEEIALSPEGSNEGSGSDSAAPASLTDDDNANTHKVDFEIYLYGASAKFKWTVVQDLLHKIADGAGQFVISALDPTNESERIRTVVLGKLDAEVKPFCNVIRIFDRTESDIPDAPIVSYISICHCPFANIFTQVRSLETPSLGLIFLPANRLPVVSAHNAYLSILATDSFSDLMYNNDKAVRNAAEDDWELLNIHPSQVLRVKANDKSPFIDAEDIKFLNARQVHRAFQSILYEDENDAIAQKESVFKVQATPANAVKVYVFFSDPARALYPLLFRITLVSVLLSIAFNASSFRSPAPTPTVNMVTPNNTWPSLAALPNRSNSVTVQGANGKAQVVVPPAKDTALSIISPGSTALSITQPQVKSLSPTAPAAKSQGVCEMSTGRGGKAQSSATSAATTAVATYGTTSLSKINTDAPSADKEATAEPSATASAVGMSFVNSLSEVLGVTTKSILKTVKQDKELMESLDELMTVVRTQTDDIIKQSKGKARAIGDQVQALGDTLQSRNDQARHRARAIRRKGKAILESAQEKMRERTAIARVRARKIRASVGTLEALQVYQQAQDDWATVLKEKGEEGWKNHKTSARTCYEKRQARKKGGKTTQQVVAECMT